MSPPFSNWIDEAAPATELVAYAMRRPDRSVVSGSRKPWFSPAHAEKGLALLLRAAEEVSRRCANPVQMCWTFERARLYLAGRPDGACLALFTENRPDFDFGAIESVLFRFREAPSGSWE